MNLLNMQSGITSYKPLNNLNFFVLMETNQIGDRKKIPLMHQNSKASYYIFDGHHSCMPIKNEASSKKSERKKNRNNL